MRKQRSPRSARAVEKPRKQKKGKAKDPSKPKRPMTAYFLWLNENRERIKANYPGISVTDLTKKAGEIWRRASPEDKAVCI